MKLKDFVSSPVVLIGAIAVIVVVGIKHSHLSQHRPNVADAFRPRKRLGPDS